MDFLRKIFEQKNVVGFDIVELRPIENEKSLDFLAAKLYYKMLSYKFQEEANAGDALDEDYPRSKPTKNPLKFSHDD